MHVEPVGVAERRHATAITARTRQRSGLRLLPAKSSFRLFAFAEGNRRMHVDYLMAVRTPAPLRKRCARAPLAAAVALCLAGSAQAATITVNDSRGDPANPNDST